MNDYSLSVDNFMGALPAVLAENDNLRALARAVSELLAENNTENERVAIYPNIEIATEELCDILAQDFDVKWYNYDYTLEKKRALIKSNFNMHRHLGTVGAVNDLVAAAFNDGVVEEWFQYDGQPYHFRIVLPEDSDFVMTQDSIRLFSRLIENVKSLRSRLDNIEVHRKIENTVYLGTILADRTAYVMSNNITREAESYVGARMLFAALAEILSTDEGNKGRDTADDLSTVTPAIGTVLASAMISRLEV